jgi:formylglycine-generating enzyme required for sulfatase activity
MSSASPPPSDTDLDFAPTLRGLRKGLKVFDARYTLVRQLGRGGMGVVWLARDEKLELEVALKFLPENLVHDEIALDDLRRETRRCMKLTHQHIVHVYDFVTDEDTAAIAMEYVEGKSFSALRLEQPGRVFEVGQLAPMVRQVCEALVYAHEQARVVHYDLKPGNLMLSSGGLVKVMDFGIAASITDSASRQSRKVSTAGMGTLHYMSPQQLGGYPPSVADDVYSLGATIYELVTGRPPFHGYRDRALEEQIQSMVPPSMGERRAELGIEGAQPVPALWEEVIAACLEKEAEKRPRSVAEVWQRLGGEAVVRSAGSSGGTKAAGRSAEGPAAGSGSVVRAGSSKKALLTGMAAVLCLGSAAGWWLGVEAPRRAEAARIEQQRVAQAAADAAEAARIARERAEAEAARLAKEKADAEEEQKRMAAAAEAARLAKEKADAEEKARAMAAEAERKRMAAQEEEQKRKEAALVAALSGAEKSAPFGNSLGMKFVPAGTPGVLFSVWETRVRDFEAFVEESGHDAVSQNAYGGLAYTLESGDEWKQAGGSWRDPRFPSKQSGEHPVVCVSYLDAEAFCAWLTKKERAAGKIPATASYRLPSDSEWNRACGSSTYPWGENYPPKSSDGNYCGKEAMVGAYEGYTNDLVKAGFRDGAARTSAVGMFKENRFGLYDMGGNVFEWCSTWYTADLNDEETKKAVPGLKDDGGGQAYRVLRGASWFSNVRVRLRSSYRVYGHPVGRGAYYGFRCVLVVAGG